MSKKDYIQFAKMFSQLLKETELLQTKDTIYEVVERTCKIFKEDNYSFDKDKFIEYIKKHAED